LAFRKARDNWLARGCASGIAGISFSVLVSALFALLIWLGVDWVQFLERRGTDLTMRSAVAFNTPVLDGLPAAARAKIAPIVFLDVDEAGCQLLAERKDRCQTDGVGQPDVLVAVGEALAASRARLIVLDVRWPRQEMFGSAEEQSRMIRAWAGPPGPPVIAALPGALSSSAGIATDWDSVRSVPTGRLQFAPSAVWPGRGDQDMVIRSFPDEIPLVGELPPGSPDRLAAMPLASVRALGGRTAGHQADGQRILFTLPSLSGSTDEDLASLHLGDWERRALSAMIAPRAPACADCSPGIRTDGLAGQVVIVGSSAPAANDLHMTPLGTMAGAEIIANAIRARQLVEAAEAPDASRLFRAKVVATLPAMGISFLASLGIAWLLRRRVRARWARVKQKSAVAALFTLALLASLLVTLQLALGNVLESERAGQQVDLLLPTLALFLEGFVAFSKWLLDSVDILILQLFERIRARFAGR
jgi:hypothetical protein